MRNNSKLIRFSLSNIVRVGIITPVPVTRNVPVPIKQVNK